MCTRFRSFSFQNFIYVPISVCTWIWSGGVKKVIFLLKNWKYWDFCLKFETCDRWNFALRNNVVLTPMVYHRTKLMEDIFLNMTQFACLILIFKHIYLEPKLSVFTLFMQISNSVSNNFLAKTGLSQVCFKN